MVTPHMDQNKYTVELQKYTLIDTHTHTHKRDKFNFNTRFLY